MQELMKFDKKLKSNKEFEQAMEAAITLSSATERELRSYIVDKYLAEDFAKWLEEKKSK